MTREGTKLAGVDPEQLRQQLRRETDAKAAKQLTVALLYDAGFSPYEIEEFLGIPAQTGYNWLEVVAEREVTALGDAPKSGRPSQLSAEQWKELTATLHASPTEAGYDDPAWSPKLLRSHIRDTYGVQYSHAHIYWILDKAGLSRQTARPYHYKADPAEKQRWREEFKKSGRR
jgi:transposase